MLTILNFLSSKKIIKPEFIQLSKNKEFIKPKHPKLNLLPKNEFPNYVIHNPVVYDNSLMFQNKHMIPKS